MNAASTVLAASAVTPKMRQRARVQTIWSMSALVPERKKMARMAAGSATAATGGGAFSRDSFKGDPCDAGCPRARVASAREIGREGLERFHESRREIGGTQLESRIRCASDRRSFRPDGRGP